MLGYYDTSGQRKRDGGFDFHSEEFFIFISLVLQEKAQLNTE